MPASNFNTFQAGTKEDYGADSAVYDSPTNFQNFKALASIREHEQLIQKVAQENNLETDFLTAIIYVEMAYFSAGEQLPLSGLITKSQIPANINLELWGHLTPDEYKNGDYSAQQISIATAGVLLADIQAQLEPPNLEAIATLYNSNQQVHVSGYGLTVAHFYRETPWEMT